jgi:DNA polymerase I
MNNDKPLIVLVDGSSYLYRAFHALPPLTNKKGQPTGAIYGVLNMLKKLLLDYQPAYIGIVFDPKGKTFRDDLYADYKAHRPPMPNDLKVQIDPLFTLIRAMGLPLIILDGYEADDVIGTIAKEAVKENFKVVISTGDKDIAQLVNEDITLINTMTNTQLDREGVINKFGVPPERIIDYLTLIGDTSDNIPGVAKVGPKTAVKWLAEYGSLQGVIDHADEIGGKVGENLKIALPTLGLSEQLVTIKCDIPLPFDFHTLKAQEKDIPQLKSLYADLEFKTWLAELERMDGGSISPKNPLTMHPENYRMILSMSDFDDLLTQLKTQILIAIDTETTSLDYMQARLVGISIAFISGDAYYIPLRHDYLGAPEQLDVKIVLEALKPFLESEKLLKVGHNLKYDISIFSKENILLKGVAFDTLLEAFLLSSGSRLDLDTLTLKHLGHKNISFEEIAGKGAKQLTFNQVNVEEATRYAAEDAEASLQLHQLFWPKIQKDLALKNVLETLEIPLVSILSEIERTGVLIDTHYLIEQSENLAKRIELLENQIYALANCIFNINSPKQLQEVLFEKLQLPIIKKTPTGQAATSEEVLQELAHEYPLPKLILEYRSLSKLKSTYTDKLPKLVNQATGRVHTSYHQVGAATGRFSSSDPNLQNIPIRTEEGRKIRQAFIAPKGYQLLAADYSQIELRIMAHFSEDEGLCQAFSKGLDIHIATAAEVFGVPLDKVSDLQRRSAKAINFGLIYGMSAFGLAKQLDIDRNSAQAYIDRYFHRYPGVKAFMEKTRQQAYDQGYVETLLGRKLYLPEIKSSNRMLKNAAERAAINAPMQGTAADIIKRAMIDVYHALKKAQLEARIIMQVHDELVFEVADKDISQAKILIPQIMQNALRLHVPLVVDVGIGPNWDEAH